MNLNFNNVFPTKLEQWICPVLKDVADMSNRFDAMPALVRQNCYINVALRYVRS